MRKSGDLFRYDTVYTILIQKRTVRDAPKLKFMAEAKKKEIIGGIPNKERGF